MWQHCAAPCKRLPNAYPLCVLSNWDHHEGPYTAQIAVIICMRNTCSKYVFQQIGSVAQCDISCVIDCLFLLWLSEAEPDRQIDSGMLKRVNPGHPLTLISWFINGLQQSYTATCVDTEWPQCIMGDLPAVRACPEDVPNVRGQVNGRPLMHYVLSTISLKV